MAPVPTVSLSPHLSHPQGGWRKALHPLLKRTPGPVLPPGEASRSAPIDKLNTAGQRARLGPVSGDVWLNQGTDGQAEVPKQRRAKQKVGDLPRAP